jgi:hypothetical protein
LARALFYAVTLGLVFTALCGVMIVFALPQLLKGNLRIVIGFIPVGMFGLLFVSSVQSAVRISRGDTTIPFDWENRRGGR